MIRQVGDVLEVKMPYSASLVARLKSLPLEDRAWDKVGRVWRVHARHLRFVQEACREAGFDVLPLVAVQNQSAPVQRLLRIEYIGAPKERSDGSFSSFAWCGGGWSVVVPNAVLRQWFDGTTSRRDTPDTDGTLYDMLLVKRNADDDDVKRAYRRLARQWHPDVCQEVNAGDVFKQVAAAYRVLSDTLLRRKYDAGLALAASTSRRDHHFDPLRALTRWTPPLRCGLLVAEGLPGVGKFAVSKILAWEDVTDGQGLVMVTTWRLGDDHFTTQWVTQ